MWAGSDIDLYTSIDSANEITQRLIKLGYRQRPFVMETGDNYYLFQRCGALLESIKMWTSLEIKSGVWKSQAGEFHTTTTTPPGSLQMMVLKAEVPTAETAIGKFDLDIVVNTWDGSTLYITSPSGLIHRVATTSEEVIAIASALGKLSDPPELQWERLCMLEDQGLISVTKPTYHLLIGLKIVFNTYFKRLYKYSIRGFTIMVGTETWTTKRLAKVMQWVMLGKYKTRLFT